MPVQRSLPACAVAIAACLAVTGGCVTSAPPSRAAGPSAVALEGVPAEPFGTTDCAAGALATVLAYWGRPVVAEELDRQLPKARNGGVLSIDLLLEARARGFEAELLEGDPAAIADSIGEGVPAIILVRVLNAPRSRADLYHYVVVDGHDPARGLLRLHFGDGVKRWAEAARIERAWKPAGHLMLRVRPAPGAEPA